MGKANDHQKAARAQTPSTTGARASGAKAARKSPSPGSSTSRKTLTFKIHAPDARNVDIAGSFNNWELKPMKRGKDGTWKATFRLQPGTYEYKFLVDHRWTEDPAHHDKVSDGHGGFNSVCRSE